MSKKEVAALWISLQLKTDELKAGIRSAQKELKSLGSAAQVAGRNISLAFTIPLTTLGTTAVKSFMTFDSAMTKSISVMGNAGKAMKQQLVDGAIQVSKTTKFSSAQAAEGYYFLATAGFDAAESLKVLPVVAEFATAAHMDLASATDRLVDVLNAVGLAGGTAEDRLANMARVSNVLAKGSMDTNTTIEDLSSSLAGPLGGAMRQYGVSVETATAFLEAFGSQGIKGRSAGTALSIVIRELGLKSIANASAFKKMNIEVFDSQGKMRNLVDILKQMDAALANLSPLERAKKLQELGFTLKNIGFIQSLLGTSPLLSGWEAANKAAAQAGYAAELASGNMESFANQLGLVRNALENVGIVIGRELAPYIIAIGKKVVELAEWFTGLSEGTRKYFYAIAAGLVIGGPILLFFGSVSLALTSLTTLFGGAGASVLAFTTLMGPTLAVALGTIPGLFTAIGITVGVFWDDIKKAAQDFIDWFSLEFPKLSSIFSTLWEVLKFGANDALENVRKTHEVAITKMQLYWQNLQREFNNYANVVELRHPKLLKILGALGKATIDLAVEGGKVISEGFQVVGNEFGDFLNETDFVQGLKDSTNAIQKAKKMQEDLAKSEGIKQKLEENTKIYKNHFSSINDLWNSQATQTAGFQDFSKAISGYINEQEKLRKFINKEEVYQSPLRKQKGMDEIIKENENATKEKNRINEAKQRAEALKGLQKTLSELESKDSVENIKESISNAIKDGASDIQFDELSKKLYKKVYDGYIEGAKDAIEKAGNTQQAQEAASKAAAIVAQQAVDETTKQRLESNSKAAADLAEKNIRAYDESVRHFEDVFSKAANTGAYDFRDALKEIFIELGANLAAMLNKAFSGNNQNGAANTNESGGLSGALGSIAQSIGESLGMTSQQGTSGIGPVANGDQYAKSLQGKSYQAEITAGIEAIFSAINAKEIDKKTKSNEGTGGAVGSAIGTSLGALFGNPELGGKIGKALGAAIGSTMKWGPQNPATQARHSFANFIEEGFAKLDKISFFDQNKKLQSMKGSEFNFLEGSSSRFNNNNWADQLNSLDKTTRATFLGLGEAMEEILGLTEDVGSQIAFLLSENLGGSIDNARLMVMQLGLSMEEMEEKLIAIGRSGEMSWLEVETGLQGVAEAFKPGLAAVGDLKGAFDQLVQSGGRGIVALAGIRNIAVEAIEAGATSLQDLGNRLLALGTNPEQVDALLASLKQRGVKTLEELAAASDRVAGGIVADMNAGSNSLANLWAGMEERIQSITKQLEAIPNEKTTNLKLFVTAEMTDDARKALNSSDIALDTGTGPLKEHAKGAIITGPIGFGGNHVMGEAGPEALLPVTRMGSGKLGVHAQMGKLSDGAKSAINITVNAPYSTQGTAQHIKQAILDIEPYLTNKAVSQVVKMNKRGGTFGRNL